MMVKRIDITLTSALIAVALFALGCQDSVTPERSLGLRPNFWLVSPACFRMTGGGRIDKPGANMGGAELPTGKNTPTSRDFATFGFQARPTACQQTSGSGHITWVEHNTDIAGGFVFHGDVNTFVSVPSEYTGVPCGRFSGQGSLKRRSDGTTLAVFFEVHHACDEAEPGVGRDHIRMLLC